MNCKKTRTKLLDYLDGNLDSKSSITLEEHISNCEGCRGFLVELKLFHSLMQIEEKEEGLPNPFLTNRVIESVGHQQVTSDKKRHKALSQLAAAAAIVILIASGILGGLEIGDLITSGLSTGQTNHQEISSLVNEMGHEPLEQMLFNFNSSVK